MNEHHLWRRAAELSPQIISGAGGGFSIGFDKGIPAEMQDELRAFVAWVEENFPVPAPLWVDFEHRHYLLTRKRKQAGYLFYWNDFKDWPRFEDEGHMPVIRLPVRTGRFTLDEILLSFIEAVSCYYLWLTNAAPPFQPAEADCEEILAAYKEYRRT